MSSLSFQLGISNLWGKDGFLKLAQCLLNVSSNANGNPSLSYWRKIVCVYMH